MILGEANNSGTAQTTLQNGGPGAAFTLKTTNPSSGATGVFGWSSSTGSNVKRGVYGRADGPSSYGVQATNMAGSTGAGAALHAIGANNNGVEASTGLSTTFAVHGVNETQDGIAMWGEAGGGIGVWGSAGGFASRGVLGTSDDGDGVAGEANGEGNGVFGRSLLGYAGYFDGDVHVAGTLSKAAGAFRIDHPLAPATKYLQHSFVESPDMKNVYDGTVSLDAKGEATVKLPAYVEPLNRDLRYQLTSLDVPAPDLHVKREVAKSAFTIAGGAAGQRVCWQITGIRQDPWAEAHRIVVEEAKPAADRGLYLHPDLYGQPEEKAVDYRHRAQVLPEAG